VKHVINFSGGLCSFWAAKRVVDRYGTTDVTLIFADTLIEDEELYLFNQAASVFLGLPITRLSREVTPWQLFRSEGLIGNARFPICSIRLKRELLDQWHRQNCLEMDSIIYVGFDWTEENRLNDLRKELPRWRFEAPMCEPPLWDKCRIIKETEAIGLPIPILYRLGFPHNNCGGRCVRAGISHWVHLYRQFPDRYLEWENEEAATITDFATRGISTDFAILRDRRGGTTKALTLRTLRARIEAGEDLPKHDWGGCGCGGATKVAA
jgi:hypothetical protein